MVMLVKNFFRDIWVTLPRLLSVIVITALGVFIFVGMSSFRYNLSEMTTEYFANQKIADYWIYGSELSMADARRVGNLDDVQAVQPRIVTEASQVRDKDVTVTLHGVEGDFNINVPLVINGRLPQNNREFVIDSMHAAANNINIGDKYELRIKSNDRRINLTVCGLIKSPEYIYNVSATEMIPNPQKTGIAFMKVEILEGAVPQGAYSELDVRLIPNADIERFKSNLEDILGDRMSMLMALKDNQRAYLIVDAAKEINTMATLLPGIFFLIAALIMFTTMSRMVESARMQVGTLKAIGYSDTQIIIYFTAYAFMVAVIGLLLGVWPSQPMASGFYSIYETMMMLPPHTVILDIEAVLSAFVMTLVFCVGTALYICIKELRERPAECMRPRPPKAMKKNFLEYCTPLWSRMSFSAKSVTRNMFRHKMRLIMCVVGVSGCMAIVLTAFGMLNSQTSFFDELFKKMHRYDVQVVMQPTADKAQVDRIMELEGVIKAEPQSSVRVTIDKNDNKEGTQLGVVNDTISLMMLDINAGDTMDMPSDGIILASTIAKKLDIREGDTISVNLSGRSKTVSLRVSRIIGNITGCYAGRTYWRTISGTQVADSIYIKAENPSRLKERISEYDFVLAAMDKNQIIESIEQQLTTMYTMVFVFILFGGVLAFSVLYNLGIMNYLERIRELATLKVLGFYDKEIKTLVLRENLLFALMGVIIGMPLGYLLLVALLVGSATAGYDISINIQLSSYLTSALITLGFGWLVNLMLGRKFKNVDMIGALKSIE